MTDEQLEDIASNIYNLCSIILGMDDLPEGRAEWIEKSIWEAVAPISLKDLRHE